MNRPGRNPWYYWGGICQCHAWAQGRMIHLDALRFFLKPRSHFSCCFTDPQREAGTQLHTMAYSRNLFQNSRMYFYSRTPTPVFLILRGSLASQMTKPPVGQQQFMHGGVHKTEIELKQMEGSWPLLKFPMHMSCLTFRSFCYCKLFDNIRIKRKKCNNISVLVILKLWLIAKKDGKCSDFQLIHECSK